MEHKRCAYECYQIYAKYDDLFKGAYDVLKKGHTTFEIISSLFIILDT